MRWSLRYEPRIVQLPLRRLKTFIELGQLLIQPFAFCGNVDLSLVNERNIEVRRRTRVVSGWCFLRNLNTAHPRQPREHVGVLLRKPSNSLRAVHTDRRGLLLRDAQI